MSPPLHPLSHTVVAIACAFAIGGVVFGGTGVGNPGSAGETAKFLPAGGTETGNPEIRFPLPRS